MTARHPPPNCAPPLRVGLLLNQWSLPAWSAALVREIQQSKYAEIALCVLNAEQTQTPPPMRRLIKRRSTLLYSLYSKVDRALTKAPPDPFAPVDLKTELAGIAHLDVLPMRKRHVHRFSEDDLAAIRSAELDVLLRFGFAIIRGGILDAARHGVWSYHHGDNRTYRGAPPCFWEIHNRAPVTAVTLQRLTENLDAGNTLYRSFSATHPTSQHQTIKPLYWKGARLVPRCLQRLHRDGWDALAGQRLYSEPIDTATPVYRLPRNRQMVGFLARTTLSSVGRSTINRLRYPQWFLAWRKARPLDVDAARPLTGADFKLIEPPPGRFYADPFAWREGDRSYLFFEDWSLAQGRARISLMSLEPGEKWTAPRPILDTGSHLSYPFLLQWKGEIYMIPETASRRRVEIYRAEAFPDQWACAGIQLEGHRVVDTTVLPHDGRLWIFANIASHGASSHDELHLFLADDLLGEWIPHPMSPVVSDVRQARPAGRIFRAGTRLIRPSQDCSRRYGYGLNFNEISDLSDATYHETFLSKVEPDWMPDNLGSHTWNSDGHIDVTDGHRLASKPSAYLIRRCLSALGRTNHTTPTG